jgi:ribonuclease BN (tRNA processing enzyme)
LLVPLLRKADSEWSPALARNLREGYPSFAESSPTLSPVANGSWHRLAEKNASRGRAAAKEKSLVFLLVVPRRLWEALEGRGVCNVKVTLLPSSVSDRAEKQHQFMTSYLIDDTLAVDAGCLGFHGTAREQAQIKHVLLSHSHIDHLGSLPIFVDNVFEAGQTAVTVYGSAAVLECLRADVFNDRVWPDYFRLSSAGAPPLKLVQLEPDKTVAIAGLHVTPVPVDHVVPTLGFVIEGKDGAIIIVSDTGPTERIWEYANRTAHLKAVFLEVAFPVALAGLAEVTKHLTTAQLAQELRKLNQPVTVLAVHLKARYRDQIVRELEGLAIPNLEIGRFGRPYVF